MDSKEIFLKSLYDEQTDFYYAHEHDSNLEELLRIELNVNQLEVYIKWKNEEAIASNGHIVLTEKLERLEQMLENITTRLDVLEKRTNSKEIVRTSNETDPVNERIDGIRKDLKKVMAMVDTIERRVTKVNVLVGVNMNTLLANVKRIETSQSMLAERIDEIKENDKVSLEKAKTTSDRVAKLEEKFKTPANKPVIAKKGLISFVKLGADGRLAWVPTNQRT